MRLWYKNASPKERCFIPGASPPLKLRCVRRVYWLGAILRRAGLTGIGTTGMQIEAPLG